MAETFDGTIPEWQSTHASDASFTEGVRAPFVMKEVNPAPLRHPDPWRRLWLYPLSILVLFAAGLAAPTLGDLLLPGPAVPESVLDYGRLTQALPQFHIDEPASVLLVYMTPGQPAGPQIAEMDELAASLVEPGDLWVYYFDTLNDGTIWLMYRCAADEFDVDINTRNCQYSQFIAERPTMEVFDGFVSAMER